jgi:hypothetical protein
MEWVDNELNRGGTSTNRQSNSQMDEAIQHGIPEDVCLRDDIATDNPDIVRPPQAAFTEESHVCTLVRIQIHHLYATRVFEAIVPPFVRPEFSLAHPDLMRAPWLQDVLARARAAPHLTRCPAPNPISMDPPHLKLVKRSEPYGTYLVTPKADGTRYQLLLTNVASSVITAGVGQLGESPSVLPCGFIVDRKMDVYPVVACAPPSAFRDGGTLLDMELVKLNSSGELCFLVIDLVAVSGNVGYSRLPLQHRLNTARSIITHLQLRMHGDSAPIPIRVKDYFPIARALDVAERRVSLDYDTDGIIFISDDLQVAKFTCPVSFKIKAEHTVDLLLFAEPCRDAQGNLVTSCEGFSYKHAGEGLYRQTMVEKKRIMIDAAARSLTSSADSSSSAASCVPTHGRSTESVKKRRVTAKQTERASREQKQLTQQKEKMFSFMQKLKTPVKLDNHRGAAAPTPAVATDCVPVRPPSQSVTVTRQSPPAVDQSAVEAAAPVVGAADPSSSERTTAAEPQQQQQHIRWMLKMMYLIGDKLHDAAAGFELKDEVLSFRLVRNDQLKRALDVFDQMWLKIENKRKQNEMSAYVPLHMKCVVECACTYVPEESRVNCEIRKIRSDKRDPNSYAVIVGTLLSIDRGVTVKDLERMC